MTWPFSTSAVSRVPGSWMGGSPGVPVAPPASSTWRESSARCPGSGAVRPSWRCPARVSPPLWRPLPARVTVTAPSSSRRSSCDRRSSRPSAILPATGSVGLGSPRSTWESIGALTPLRWARSRSERPIASRRALTRGPIVIQTYVIAYVGRTYTDLDGRRKRPRRRADGAFVARRLSLLGGALLCLLTIAAPAPARSVHGTDSPDRLHGGGAADTLHGAGGNDVLRGNAGGDTLFGESGPDQLWGGAGDDVLDGDSGIDLLDGGPGDDIVSGGFGADTIRGDGGNDTLDGGADDDKVSGGDGNDVLHGQTGTDLVDGGAGDDEVYADSGPDTLLGGAGDDTVYANTGGAVQRVDCGEGDDVLFMNPYDEPGGVSDRQMIDDGRVAGCEQIVAAAPVADPTKGVKYLAKDSGGRKQGTELDDNLLGGTGADQIFGLDGNDIIWGKYQAGRASSASDVLDGGPGDDTIYGGPGATRILGGSGDDKITGGTGRNTISGGDGRDVIRLRGRARNVVSGGAGNDVIQAVGGRGNRISCGPGRDKVVAHRADGVARDCERVQRRP